MEKQDYYNYDLVLFIINDCDIYRHYTRPTIENLKKHHLSGKWTKEKALRSYMRIVNEGVNKYYRDINTDIKFTLQDRKQAASDLYDYYLDEVVS